MDLRQNEEAEDAWVVFEREVGAELEQSRRALKELTMMLEQSQAELTKLTQRNQSITSHLQQIQAQFDTVPRSDIRMVYNAALEAQQRLLVMRGQLEKLQSDQSNTQRLVTLLEKAQEMFASGEKPGKPMRFSSGTAALEMVINAQEAVRQRLSTQMHDGPAQALSNFILRMDIATRYLEIDPSKAKDELNDLKVEATRTFAKVKSFIAELRPMMLDDLGLVPTLRRYVDTFKEQTAMEVNLSIKGQERRLEPYLEVMVFRAVQELMGNASRHNQDHPVKVTINVQLTLDDSQIRVAVIDNGKGFDTQNLAESSGLGLKLIRERVEMLGGLFDIDTAIGQGCKVSFSVPCIEPAALTATE